MIRQLSLLTLPLEIRELIYDLVLQPDTFTFVDPAYELSDGRPSLMHNIVAFNIVVIGTAPHREMAGLEKLARQHHDPWLLARICRQIRHETSRKLAVVGLDSLFFSFYNFTPSDMDDWIERVGHDAVSKIRRWGIESVNWCHDWYHWADRNPRDWDMAPSCVEKHAVPHREQLHCYRAVAVDMLTAETELVELDTLAQFSHGSDGQVSFHYDHRVGAQNGAAHIHSQLIGTQCNLELRQGCLDAEEQFLLKIGDATTPVATIAGLKTLVMAVQGREQYEDERLMSKFPSEMICAG